MKLVESDIVNVCETYLQSLPQRQTGTGIHDDEVHQNMAASLNLDGDVAGVDTEQVQT